MKGQEEVPASRLKHFCKACDTFVLIEHHSRFRLIYLSGEKDHGKARVVTFHNDFIFCSGYICTVSALANLYVVSAYVKAEPLYVADIMALSKIGTSE